MALRLEDFTLERAILEIRYPAAYLHFDKAGALWSECVARWPRMTHVEGKPAQTVFAIGREFQLAVELKQARLIGSFQPRDLDEFTSIAATFFETTTRTLGISVLTRVGLRQIFFMSCKNRQEATSRVLGTGLLRSLPTTTFGLRDAAVQFPEYAVRLENEAGLSARTMLKVEERRLEYQPPPELPELSPIKKTTVGVAYDVDFYLGRLDVAQFSPRDWVTELVRALKQDSDAVLSGEGARPWI